MKNCNAPENQVTRGILPIAGTMALVLAFVASHPQPAHAGRVTPPPVPTDIQVPAGNIAFLEGHAVGTQNYVCLPCPNPITPTAVCPASGFAFTLFTPQATLSADNNRQIITHFFSPNPAEKGTIRAAWQDSRDTSTVWGGRATASSDPDFVAQDAIPWLLLPVAGTKKGPTGGRSLTAVTFIQRLNTSGGAAPSTGCDALTDVGTRAFVPYTADYFFYKKTPRGYPDYGYD
ncbi:MAG: hypothetical protein CTY16_03265 [Methylobacter sp.]|nr:MAG: hypothetical protein CTY16_03265 [Methylobacter sp.]